MRVVDGLDWVGRAGMSKNERKVKEEDGSKSPFINWVSAQSLPNDTDVPSDSSPLESNALVSQCRTIFIADMWWWYSSSFVQQRHFDRNICPIIHINWVLLLAPHAIASLGANKMAK